MPRDKRPSGQQQPSSDRERTLRHQRPLTLHDGPSTAFEDSDDIHYEDIVSQVEGQSNVDGMDHPSSSRIPRESPGNEMISRGPSISRGHRHHGALVANNSLYEELANKQRPLEDSAYMVKSLEKGVDASIQRTYLNGMAMLEVYDTAVVLKVGLVFLPGADRPQVNRIEQTNMAGKEPDQKDAAWRVDTAGSLLLQFDVSADLSIVQTDQTSIIAAQTMKRPQKHDGFFPDQMKTMALRGRNLDAVTIDSEHVKIVNDLREGHWDLQATLIEVDATSLWNLMINYRHLISRGGPDMTFEETKELLEIMIEDARRLCTRSPILFRMSTRSTIINSVNTRFGVDHGPMFRTLTTSKGIKEVISLSASYYNSLDPTGSDDSTQRFIRPRFLQMIVLLLSLLNDNDLADIQDFLESTYKIKADRRNLEMLFLKVIPLLSINPRVFLKALVPAIEGFPLSSERDEDHDHIWNVFIQRILREKYLLPGSVSELGRDDLSWIVKWPSDGFKSTTVFNNLQYGGQLRTMNEIPPIDLNPGARLKEVTAIMTDDSEYIINSIDLEKITLLTPGIYSVREAGSSNRHYDLIVQETHINDELHKAIYKMNDIVRTVNKWLVGARPNNGFKGKLIRKSSAEPVFFEEYKSSGRLTMHVALLNHVHLAVAYKIEGRKIRRTDSIQNMTRDTSNLCMLIHHIETRWSGIDHKIFSGEKRWLKQSLDDAKAQINRANQSRNRIGMYQDISSDPIAKCLYPESSERKGPAIWSDYEAWFHEGTGILRIEGTRYKIGRVKWLADEILELSFQGQAARIFATPLRPVEETFRNDEVQVDDIAVMVGEFVIIAVLDDSNGPETEYIMTNYLRVTSVEEETRSRRGQNRTRQFDTRVTCAFR